jgi:uncharacterized protein YggE
MTMIRRSYLACSLILALATSFTLSASADDDGRRHITVSGKGEVSAAPDMATMSIGVETEATTPSDAMSSNAQRMTDVMARLKEAGIDDKDLQTRQLSIWPVYAERNQPRKVIAYRANNQLSVTIRDLASLGDILDQAVKDGANQINGPSFSHASPEPLLDAARDAAIADAIAKAKRYAAAADVALGDVISIDEGGVNPGFPGRARAEAMMASTPIAPGEQSFEATVTMTFAIE